MSSELAASQQFKAILVSWLGRTDIQASDGNESIGMGPVASAIEQVGFNELVLLNNYHHDEAEGYLKWLCSSFPDLSVHLRQIKLSSPTCYSEIYQAALWALEDIHKKCPRSIITLHLSPGTPAMAAVWIILAKTKFQAELIESSKDYGINRVDFPFDLSAEFLPESLKEQDDRLARLSESLPSQYPAFEDIIYRCAPMQRVVLKARKAAQRSVPVLIEGDSGTGKELLARAIHRASPRSNGPFVAVNCGAIPTELVETELFGHIKGAYTGADSSREGYFEAAQHGTLFLDEIGELPVSAQVKVLRALQESEVYRVGSTKKISLNIRVIAATNRNLLEEIRKERFRSDLFYRLAVAVLKLPALRDRPGDLSLLIDKLLEQINAESMSEPGYQPRKISPSAKNILLRHTWPGNVRELMNTLRRAAIWSEGDTVTSDDIQEALLLDEHDHPDTGILNRSLEDGIDLPGMMGEVARHYIKHSLEHTGGNMTKAAKLLGLKNYQTLKNWMYRYGVEEKN